MEENETKEECFKREILEETGEDGELIWLSPQIALQSISKCFNELVASKYDSVHSTKFIVKRDEAILKEYITKYILNK